MDILNSWNSVSKALLKDSIRDFAVVRFSRPYIIVIMIASSAVSLPAFFSMAVNRIKSKILAFSMTRACTKLFPMMLEDTSSGSGLFVTIKKSNLIKTSYYQKPKPLFEQIKGLVSVDIIVQSMWRHLSPPSSAQPQTGAIANSEQKGMVYAITNDSFVFFYSSSNRSFGSDVWIEMAKFLFEGVTREQLEGWMKEKPKECARILQEQKRHPFRKIVMANLETGKHYVVQPEFVVIRIDNVQRASKVTKTTNQGPASLTPVIDGTFSEGDRIQKLDVKSCGFTGTIDGKEELFGMVTDFKFDNYIPGYKSGKKHQFLRELVRFGFPEQTILAYMTRYLKNNVLSDSLDSGEIMLCDFLEFLEPMFKKLECNVFLVLPVEAGSTAAQGDQHGTLRRYGHYLLPGPCNYIMEVVNNRLSISYGQNVVYSKFVEHEMLGGFKKSVAGIKLH
jgi:hypothetical protein